MDRIFKDGYSASDFILQKPKNFSFDEILRLEQDLLGGRPIANEEFYDQIRQQMASEMGRRYGLSGEQAQLLVDGALSNPYEHKGIHKDKSYGIFKAEPTKDTNAGAEEARKLFDTDSDAFGIMYGYATDDGRHYKLANPISFKKEEDVRAYDAALSGNRGGLTRMKAVYRDGGK